MTACTQAQHVVDTAWTSYLFLSTGKEILIISGCFSASLGKGSYSLVACELFKESTIYFSSVMTSLLLDISVMLQLVTHYFRSPVINLTCALLLFLLVVFFKGA